MAPKNVIVVPTYRRPEMLALALGRISAAEGSRDTDVRIFLDHTTNERLNDVEWVRDNFYPTADIFHANTHCLLPSGTWNILHALKTGWESGAPLIFFIEEDVLIRPEFFKKHIEMQNSGDFFVTCGRKLSCKDEFYYSNPGSAYRREKLGLVVPHINNQFFSDHKGYIEKNFKPCDDAGLLDDGLIRRVMMSVDGKALCAVPRIASHIGFHFYGKMPDYTVSGTIAEKIAQLRTILASIDPNGRYTRDFEPYQEPYHD